MARLQFSQHFHIQAVLGAPGCLLVFDQRISSDKAQPYLIERQRDRISRRLVKLDPGDPREQIYPAGGSPI